MAFRSFRLSFHMCVSSKLLRPLLWPLLFLPPFICPSLSLCPCRIMSALVFHIFCPSHFSSFLPSFQLSFLLCSVLFTFPPFSSAVLLTCLPFFLPYVLPTHLPTFIPSFPPSFLSFVCVSKSHSLFFVSSRTLNLSCPPSRGHGKAGRQGWCGRALHYGGSSWRDVGSAEHL